MRIEQSSDSNSKFFAPRKAFLNNNILRELRILHGTSFSRIFLLRLPARVLFPLAAVLRKEGLSKAWSIRQSQVKLTCRYRMNWRTSTAKKGSESNFLKNWRKMKLMRLIRSLYDCSRGSDFWSARIILNNSRVDTYVMPECQKSNPLCSGQTNLEEKTLSFGLHCLTMYEIDDTTHIFWRGKLVVTREIRQQCVSNFSLGEFLKGIQSSWKEKRGSPYWPSQTPQRWTWSRW